MRSIPFYPLVVVLLVSLGGYLGCDPNNIDPSLAVPTGIPTSTGLPQSGNLGGNLGGNPGASPRPGYGSGQANAATASIPQRSVNTLLIGSFNMQRLGPSKLADPWTMDKFAQIIRLFDVIALQEITSSDQRTLPILVELVNQGGRSYDYTISPRIGRGSGAGAYFEQYAFVFDRMRVVSQANMCYVVNDTADVLHREPFVGRFQAITNAGRPFAFSLINIHTDPDEIRNELDVLADVYMSVRQYEYPEDDILLLGDLNAAPGGLGKLETIPDLVPVIQNVFTNTRQSKILDNILLDRRLTREFTGRAGVFNTQREFRLQTSDADRVSDHLPVWAEFSILEQQDASVMMGTNSGGVVR